jgi:tetratricopeptide (TPR) repeat protein
MPRIFISYRRSDSSMFTGRIHDQLKARFGANTVFRDMYNIPAGSDFRSVIDKAITSTDVCLVIIGPHWLARTGAEGKRRLDDPNDFVRIEVEAALKNPRTRVIPVLVDNATMPTADELPASLAELAYRNAIQVRGDPDFPHDIENLIYQLRRPHGRRIARRLWVALPLIFLLLIPVFSLFSAQTGKETSTSTSAAVLRPPETTTAVMPPSTPTSRPTGTATLVALSLSPTPWVEPVGPGESMVLVAQMEQMTGARQRDVTRFIVNDLVQRFETSPLVANIRIREYGDVIKSTAQARDVAKQWGAALVLWGQYDDEAATINVQLGSPDALPGMVLDRATVERTVNVRLMVKQERQETLAYPILTALGFLNTAENNYLEMMRLLASLNQIEAPPPEVIGDSVAAHAYKAAWAFYLSDSKTAVNEFAQGINLDVNNPLLYVLRALISPGSEGFQLSRQDLTTALLLSPHDWIIPYYIRGNESLVTNDLSAGVDAYTQIIEERPDDWLAYNQRGYLYLRAQKYDEARADIEKSIALGPKTEWPYMWATLVALRQGRLSDVPVYMGDIMANPSKDPAFVQQLMTAIFGEENSRLLGASMAAIENLAFAQYDASVQSADKVLQVLPNYAEMYLLEGLSYCNIENYPKAEEVYSKGLEADPSFTMLHFLRAEVRARQGNANGAAEDLSVVAQSNISENLKPYIEAAKNGQFSCKQITSIASR